MNYKDLSGLKFGRLTVTDEHEIRGEKNQTIMYWKCVCDCGNSKWVRGNSLSYGTTKSCGCLRKECVRRTHGFTGTRIYRIYAGMHQRCENSKDPAYKYYGGRGIKICAEWSGESGFVCFKDWAFENGYAENLSIDRINVNGDYEPSNCRWATDDEQRMNRRITIKTEIDGKTFTARDLAKDNNMCYKVVASRVKESWNVNHILDTPPEKAMVEYQGKMVNLRELSEITGISYNTLCTRYGKGYSDADITEPYMHSIKKRTLQCDKDGRVIAEYESASDASRATGIRRSGIIMCCNSQRKTCGGYMWKYADTELHIRVERRKHRASGGGWIDNRGMVIKEF